MSWGYDPALNTDKDKVRFLIGDTDTNRELVQDETIEAVLLMEANIYMTAAQVLESIARALTSGGVLEDRKVGETRLRYRSVAQLKADAASLKARGMTHMKPEAGGIYTTDTDTYDSNTALDKPEIAKRMTNNPRTGSAWSLTNKTT